MDNNMYFDTKLKVVTFAATPFKEPDGKKAVRYVPIPTPMPEGNDWQWDGSKWYQEADHSNDFPIEKWKIEATLLELGFDPDKELPPILKAKWRSENSFLPEDEILQEVISTSSASKEDVLARARELK